MSGHNKWSTIKHTKEKNDAANAKLFTKLGREITVAVKLGGGDPNSNPKLKNLMQKAKSINMPNDNVQRLIKKALGEQGSVNYESNVYEGYGPGGSAVIVNVLTDNKNRTASEMRHAFDRFGGSLGSTNCVSYLFTKKGIIIVENGIGYNYDEIMEHALESGADDVEMLDDCYKIIVSPENFESAKEYFMEKNITMADNYIDMIPQNYLTLPEDKLTSFGKLINMLEDNDDVQEVYHNVENYEE